MALISEHLTRSNAFRSFFGLEVNETWDVQAKNVAIERNVTSNITLEFEGQNGTVVVKQADVVLDSYPLAYTQNYSQQDALKDLDYVSYLLPVSLPSAPPVLIATYSMPGSKIPTAQP